MIRGEYMVVTDTLLSRLVEKVNEIMADNWMPTGGLSIESTGNAVVYHQAMTRLRFVGVSPQNTKWMHESFPIGSESEFKAAYLQRPIVFGEGS